MYIKDLILYKIIVIVDDENRQGDNDVCSELI